MKRPTGLILLSLGLLIGGCVHPRAPLTVTDNDPSIKILAIKKAVREKDLRVAPQLIQDLENDDPAIRLYAINGLEQLTGQRFGYETYAPDAQRHTAVQKWRQWLTESGNPR